MNIEVPDLFEVRTIGHNREVTVQIRLWGDVIFSNHYPFDIANSYKVGAAIRDTKKDFTSSLHRALKSTFAETA